MKVALVYDRVNKWGGAERVLLSLHRMFPDAPLYTSVYDEKKASWAKVFPKVYTSFLQNVPFIGNAHELFGWLMPFVFESFDFSKYDLVISVTSEAAKGIITKPGTRHICYMLTPTRYLWSHYDLYFNNRFLKYISKPFIKYLWNWDVVAAQRPDEIIAISSEVQRRIIKYYKRDSEVIFPSVVNLNKDNTYLGGKSYYLIVSRLVAYKKVDLAIRAFNRLGLPLVIVGSGSEERRLKFIARKNVKFAGLVANEKLIEYYKNAKAFIMPQEEDFGIASVEAQSFGIPIISFKKGGSIDSAPEKAGNTFFLKQEVDSLMSAVAQFEKGSVVNRPLLVENAKRFSEYNFKKAIIDFIDKRK